MLKRVPKGSVRKFNNGLYQGRVMLGYDPETGREIRPVVYGESEREAWKKLEQVIERYERGQPLQESRIKFGEWLNQWLENHVKIKNRLTTWENYKWAVDTHINPALGKINLKDLRASHLQKLYREKLENGRNDDKGGLSARTIQLIHRICHAALEQAVREDVIYKNVSHNVSLPKKTHKEILPMSPEQIKKFLKVNREDPLFPAFFILISTGMRRGELLGLKWSDIDLDNRTIFIQRSWVKSSTETAQFSDPKTKKSRRLVPLLEEGVAVLRQHRLQQQRNRDELRAKGKAYTENGLVFCRIDGAPYYPSTLNSYLEKALQRAGLPKFRMHDLRHTFASLMVEQGTSIKVVQELMGHATVQMTLDTYTHVLPGATAEAVNKLQGFFKEEETSSREAQDEPQK